jgi:hypothetical protein
MELPREFENINTFQDLYKALRQYTYSLDKILLLATLSILIGVIDFYLLDSAPVEEKNTSVVISIAVITSVLIFIISLYLTTYLIAVYMFRNRIKGPHITLLTHEGLMLVSEMISPTFNWKLFTMIRRKNGLILLYRNKKLMMTYVSRTFKNQEEETNFFEICEAKIKAALTSEDNQILSSVEPLER